jgi:hypothetical protein
MPPLAIYPTGMLDSPLCAYKMIIEADTEYKRKRGVALCSTCRRCVLLRAGADMGSESTKSPAKVCWWFDARSAVSCRMDSVQSSPQPKVAMGLIIRGMERKAGEHCKSMGKT